MENQGFPTINYRKNWDEIFKKNLEGTVINIETSFTI